MTFFGDWLIIVLFGQDYHEAGEIVIIHVWSSVFVFLGVVFSKHLVAESLTKLDMQRTLLGAISNILLNFLLIPAWGVVGAAIATLLAQFITNIGYDLMDRRLYKQLRMKVQAFIMPWRFI